ncbi:MAG: hypothetical protein HOY75_09585 [Streptomyces sp.]|nr:hypothetical protein [Streptomyces sp.]
MSETLHHTADAIPAPLRELLVTLLEAIDIPHPATVGGSEAYNKVSSERAAHAVVALRSILDDKPLMGIEWTTTYLRERLAEHPPAGYVTVDQAHAALAEGKTWSQAVTLPADGADAQDSPGASA